MATAQATCTSSFCVQWFLEGCWFESHGQPYLVQEESNSELFVFGDALSAGATRWKHFPMEELLFPCNISRLQQVKILELQNKT